MAKIFCHHLFCWERRKISGVGFYYSGAFSRARATHEGVNVSRCSLECLFHIRLYFKINTDIDTEIVPLYICADNYVAYVAFVYRIV